MTVITAGTATVSRPSICDECTLSTEAISHHLNLTDLDCESALGCYHQHPT